MLTAKPLVDLARRASRSIFKTAFYSPHWRIGWRFVDESDDVWSRGDLGGRPWQVLRNKPFRFFADPFPVAWNGKTWLFFEDFDHRIGKGRISAVAFGPRGPEGDVFPVLEQPWHLSFPYVFEHEGELWMLPESSNNRTVSLYRAQNFPTRWVKEKRQVTALSCPSRAGSGCLRRFNTTIRLARTSCCFITRNRCLDRGHRIPQIRFLSTADRPDQPEGSSFEMACSGAPSRIANAATVHRLDWPK